MKARALIKLPAKNEKGLSHRFIWMSINLCLAALEEVNKEFLEEMDKYVYYI